MPKSIVITVFEGIVDHSQDMTKISDFRPLKYALLIEASLVSSYDLTKEVSASRISIKLLDNHLAHNKVKLLLKLCLTQNSLPIL